MATAIGPGRVQRNVLLHACFDQVINSQLVFPDFTLTLPLNMSPFEEVNADSTYGAMVLIQNKVWVGFSQHTGVNLEQVQLSNQVDKKEQSVCLKTS